MKRARAKLFQNGGSQAVRLPKECRFDAPGDFQLLLREDFTAVDGFNEEMLLGYHVDSNLSRRMYLRRGSIESLGERLAGYHCNHNRVPTAYHGAHAISNDLERFFYAVDQAELPGQRKTWGLTDITLEEVPIQHQAGVKVAERVSAAIPSTPGPRGSSSAVEAERCACVCRLGVTSAAGARLRRRMPWR